MTVEQLTKNMSDTMLRLNASIFGFPPNAEETRPEKANTAKTAKNASAEKAQTECRRRMDTLNKTERRYYDTFLAEEVANGVPVIVQAPRFLELDGGGTYTPDFVVVREWGLEIVEIKGGYMGPGWEQGIERYRRVAAQYDSDRMRFRMATWDRKRMQWKIVEWKRRQVECQ